MLTELMLNHIGSLEPREAMVAAQVLEQEKKHSMVGMQMIRKPSLVILQSNLEHH